MDRWWWIVQAAAGLAMATLLVFILWPAIPRLRGRRARRAGEPDPQRVQMLLPAASVGLLAALGVSLVA
jgi:hypothetical protein